MSVVRVGGIAVDSYLLSLWMIIFGVALVRDDNRSASFSDPENSFNHASTS